MKFYIVPYINDLVYTGPDLPAGRQGVFNYITAEQYLREVKAIADARKGLKAPFKFNPKPKTFAEPIPDPPIKKAGKPPRVPKWKAQPRELPKRPAVRILGYTREEVEIITASAFIVGKGSPKDLTDADIKNQTEGALDKAREFLQDWDDYTKK